MINQLRSFLRIGDTKIIGELGVTKSATAAEFELRAYVSGTEIWSTITRGQELRNVVAELADKLVEHFDPLSAGFFIFVGLRQTAQT